MNSGTKGGIVLITVGILALAVLSSFLANWAKAEERPVEPAPVVVVNPTIPNVTFGVATGFVLLLKNGGSPGPLLEKISLALSWKVAPKVGLSVSFGFVNPGAEFKPSPQIALAVGYTLTERWSLATAIFYQLNPGYGQSTMTHMLGLSVSPSMKIVDWFSVGFAVAAINTVGTENWRMVFFLPVMNFTFR